MASKRSPPRVVKTTSTRVGHLPHAPIVEALLDIRVVRRPELKLADLEPMQAALGEAYPNRQTRHTMVGKFDFSNADGPPNPIERREDGYLFRSVGDLPRVVQVQLDGFTFSWLKPYQTWERLRDEARATWRHYVRVATPSQVTRVALRYVNRMELPRDQVHDFGDWVLTRPEIATGLHAGVSEFFMRVVTPLAPRRFAAVIQTIDTSAAVGPLPLIFDIDVFQEGLFAPDGEDMWTTLESLRGEKNRIFFGSITPRARSLFE